MNADGSDTIQLTTNSNNDAGPSWSPDGSDIKATVIVTVI